MAAWSELGFHHQSGPGLIQSADLRPSYQIEYGPAGLFAAAGDLTSTSNFVISGLTASTVYDVYVEALCTNGQYTNAASGTFSTAATFNLPYSSDMSLTAFSCWVASDPNYVYINADCPSAGNSELPFGVKLAYMQNLQIS